MKTTYTTITCVQDEISSPGWQNPDNSARGGCLETSEERSVLLNNAIQTSPSSWNSTPVLTTLDDEYQTQGLRSEGRRLITEVPGGEGQAAGRDAETTTTMVSGGETRRHESTERRVSAVSAGGNGGNERTDWATTDLAFEETMGLGRVMVRENGRIVRRSARLLEQPPPVFGSVWCRDPRFDRPVRRSGRIISQSGEEVESIVNFINLNDHHRRVHFSHTDSPEEQEVEMEDDDSTSTVADLTTDEERATLDEDHHEPVSEDCLPATASSNDCSFSIRSARIALNREMREKVPRILFNRQVRDQVPKRWQEKEDLKKIRREANLLLLQKVRKRQEFNPRHDKKAIKDYTSKGFEDINKALRSGKAIPVDIQKRVDAIICAMSKEDKHMPIYHGTVYRGVKLPSSIHKMLRANATFSDPAFLSTTSQRDRHFGSAGEGATVFEIESKTGVDISKKSSASKRVEAEVLFRPNTMFMIKSVKRNEPYYHFGMKTVVKMVELA